MSRLGLATIITVLLLSLSSTQSHAQSCDQSGTVQRQQYQSYLLGQEMYYSVYLPPCYDASAEAYPVAYLMHGSNDDDGHWLRLGLQAELDPAILSGELPPFVVVMPFGNVIANRNRFDASSWGNIFLQELMPDAETHFNIARTQAGRVIGGISRGGFWAYQIDFRHPTLFSAVGGHSAFFDLYHAPEDQNPLDLALSANGLESMRLWLDYGADDFAAPGLDIMHQRLEERGLEHTFMQYAEGQHNNAYWSAHMGEYLHFYAAGWQQETQEQSTPTQPAFSGFATNTPIAPIATPEGSNRETFFPVVGFPSLQTSISSAEVQTVAQGEYDERLVLDHMTQAALQLAGFDLHPNTLIIQDGDMREYLWGNREHYSLLPMEQITPQMRLLFVDDVPVLDQLATYPF
ncbi:MAG: esterase family protein, partial [Anaerolineae bacterium]|nr:esterase family protein [Anaerolineae bacterium]